MRPDAGYLPSPYAIHLSPAACGVLGAPSGLGTGGVAAANRGHYLAFALPLSQKLASISMICSVTSSGNYDLGIYDGATFARMASKGSTASAVGINTFTLPTPILLEAGKRYYVAFSASAGTFHRSTSSVLKQRLSGHAQEASAVPLPATMTPAQDASTFVPYLFLGFV